MGKSVKVHDDTHRALRELKVQKRSRSIDEVIREMIRISTGIPVERHARKPRTTELTSF
jgi:hypothetical protein